MRVDGQNSIVRRGGVTLLEVLVAIFVMGIGLLALLTLFPLGAMRMAAAFKDERAAQAAVNARNVATMKNIRGDANVIPKFKNYGGGVDADPNDLSYPVFVDPHGATTLNDTMLGTYIARVSPEFVSTTPNWKPYFYLLDDLTFQRNLGVPKQYGANVERELLYSWAYMVQRPRSNEGSIVNATACVFQRRSKTLPLDNEYAATFYPSKNVITMTYPAGTTPAVAAGGWVLDASKPAAKNYALANFYRVTGVRDGAAANTLELDLQSPLLSHTEGEIGKVILMDGLVEVFELGPGKQ